LRDVEHGEALEKWHRCRLVALAPGALLFVLRDEAVGVADGGAALALADRTAQVQRLPEGQPLL